MRTEERAPRTPFVLDFGALRGGPQKSRAESPVHPHTCDSPNSIFCYLQKSEILA